MRDVEDIEGSARMREPAPTREAFAVDPAGDTACWLPRVCDECGALVEGVLPASCWRCGALVGAD